MAAWSACSLCPALWSHSGDSCRQATAQKTGTARRAGTARAMRQGRKAPSIRTRKNPREWSTEYIAAHRPSLPGLRTSLRNTWGWRNKMLSTYCVSWITLQSLVYILLLKFFLSIIAGVTLGYSISCVKRVCCIISELHIFWYQCVKYIR